MAPKSKGMVNANTLKQWKADRKKGKETSMKHEHKISNRPIKKGRLKSNHVAKNVYADSTTLERVKVKVGPPSLRHAEKLYMCIVIGCGRVAISQEDIACARSQSEQIELTCANEQCVKAVKLEWQKRFTSMVVVEPLAKHWAYLPRHMQSVCRLPNTRKESECLRKEL